MEVSIDLDRRCRLNLAGEVDIATVDGLIALGLYCLKQATIDQLVIDLGAVTFLDAGGLGALVVLNEAARDFGKTVALASPSPGIQKLLGITGLDRAFVVPPAGASRVVSSADRSRRAAGVGICPPIPGTYPLAALGGVA